MLLDSVSKASLNFTLLVERFIWELLLAVRVHSSNHYGHPHLPFSVASILKLSQESSYNLGPDASVEAVISAEVSRRTWWVIFSKSIYLYFQFRNLSKYLQ